MESHTDLGTDSWCADGYAVTTRLGEAGDAINILPWWETPIHGDTVPAPQTALTIIPYGTIGIAHGSATRYPAIHGDNVASMQKPQNGVLELRPLHALSANGESEAGSVEICTTALELPRRWKLGVEFVVATVREKRVPGASSTVPSVAVTCS